MSGCDGPREIALLKRPNSYLSSGTFGWSGLSPSSCRPMRDLNQDNAIAAVVKMLGKLEAPMKKPVLSMDELQPKKPPRADRPPAEGFTVIVDGHFKSDFEMLDAAEASGRKLKSTYPMLKIEIYDAATRVRTLLS